MARVKNQQLPQNGTENKNKVKYYNWKLLLKSTVENEVPDYQGHIPKKKNLYEWR